MIADTQNNSVIVFEIGTDPQAADKLKDLMAQFSANATTAPSNGGLLLTTMNSIPADTGINDALLRRFKDVVVFKPLGEDSLKKIFDLTTGKLLDKKGLTPRQRGAAEKFVAASMQAYDPAQGARGMAKHAAGILGGSDFTELMEEHSPAGTKRGFEKAIKGGVKASVTLPATARFTRRRAP
ncbi:MAG: hypothetical protein K0R10_218 [Alphaproteobacteria bacterium]|nr:hypothetical protein [Alphaproteobacteria bacterium]